MLILASEALFRENKKIQLQNATIVSIEPLEIWFQVQHAPLHTNLTFAYKTETLGSLYSHALLILLKSSKSKHQVVHEQKFKDLLSSTCQVSVERIVLDLESEAAWVLFPLGVTFCHWIFSRSKASDANISNFVNLRKTRLFQRSLKFLSTCLCFCP